MSRERKRVARCACFTTAANLTCRCAANQYDGCSALSMRSLGGEPREPLCSSSCLGLGLGVGLGLGLG